MDIGIPHFLAFSLIRSCWFGMLSNLSSQFDRVQAPIVAESEPRVTGPERIRPDFGLRWSFHDKRLGQTPNVRAVALVVHQGEP